jgi:hypothetical protein
MSLGTAVHNAAGLAFFVHSFLTYLGLRLTMAIEEFSNCMNLQIDRILTAVAIAAVCQPSSLTSPALYNPV